MVTLFQRDALVPVTRCPPLVETTTKDTQDRQAPWAWPGAWILANYCSPPFHLLCPFAKMMTGKGA